uniref:Peripheral-type benzodiazepine receptor-associated protein 1-like n=1 Tax=Saccoglossus kowalevskii TaxID=10224 RepID=A0ABM0LVK3_SACKO|nr:PREDICTED: peripheral-type benzodiazepine receptor-associated protein 1-like [Saccoglossus kowalevskii]
MRVKLKDGTSGGAQDIDHYKKVFARQRAKDLADNAQKILAKDKEVNQLRKELEKLKHKQLDPSLENSNLFGEKDELQRIVKENAKEQLRLQRQISTSIGDRRSADLNSVTLQEYRALEETNQVLQEQLRNLKLDKEEKEKLEVDLASKRIECNNLQAESERRQQQCSEFATELQNAIQQNTVLTRKNTELQQEISHLDKINEDRRRLQEQVIEIEVKNQTLSNDRDNLKDTVDKLEAAIKHMQDAAEKRKQLEAEYQEARNSLQSKQDEIRQLQQEQEAAKKTHRHAVDQLEHKVQELERKCGEQTETFSKLSQELSSLRHDATSRRAGSPKVEIAIQTSPESLSDEGFGDNGSMTPRKQDEKRKASSVSASLAAEGVLDDVSRDDSASVRSHRSAKDDSRSSKSKPTKELENGKADDSGSEADDIIEEISEKIDMNVLRHTVIPKREKLAVFIARYSYDPLLYSPNENPEAELALNAGEYIYVYGDMDEDGFYEGELMDGRRGLVPSNFIERVADEDDVTMITEDEDMPEFLQDTDGEGDNLDLEIDSSDEDDALLLQKHTFTNEFQQPHYRRAGDHTVSDLEDIPEVEEDNLSLSDSKHSCLVNTDSLTSISEIDDFSSGEIPAPKKLELERQMSDSIILQWIAPDTIALKDIKEFRVFVDSQLKASIRGDAKTRALIDRVNPSESHRISVRTVTHRGQSHDAACTITIGKESTAAPSNLKAANVAPTSAEIMWLPGNSNLAHVISVNNLEVRTVKPGIYKYVLTGLSPSSVYRVNVRAKGRKLSWDDNRNKRGISTEIEFKTIPGGLPDPPLDVQVEDGPYSGSLLVTWLPVTITISGTSNGAMVTGYAVYVDEQELGITDSPTADRLVVNTSKIKSTPFRYLTVRTLSSNGPSADSRGLRIPKEMVRVKKPETLPDGSRPGGGMYENVSPDDSTSTLSEEIVETFRKDSMSPVSANLEDRLDQVPIDDIALIKKPEIRPSFREELHSEDSSDRSELSDIAEEVEEELTDTDDMAANNNNEFKGMQPKNVKSNHELEFDTDPEMEQFSREDLTVPIPVIRQQTDYDRETEQSPDHHVQEPVPLKPKPITVPQIGVAEITKDSNSEGLGTGSTISDHYGSDQEFDSHGQQRYSPGKEKNYRQDQYNNRYERYQERKETYGSPVEQERRNHNYRDSLSPNDIEGESTGSEPPEELYDDSTVRYFVALFTYDPSIMSPNEDAIDEELPFTEGQLIKVYGDKDSDGFFHGEANGRTGFVPCNMVVEAQLDEKSAEERFVRESLGNSPRSRSPRSATISPSSSNSVSYSPRGEVQKSANGKAHIPVEGPIHLRKMVALFDYDPRQASPNVDSDVELAFKTGDIILVDGEMDDDGFFLAEIRGERGLVPSNFLEEVPLTPSPVPSPTPSRNSNDKTSAMSNKNSSTTKSLDKEKAKATDIESSKPVANNTNTIDKKKNKGIFSKGKALFKKFGTSDNATGKSKR